MALGVSGDFLARWFPILALVAACEAEVDRAALLDACAGDDAAACAELTGWTARRFAEGFVGHRAHEPFRLAQLDWLVHRGQAIEACSEEVPGRRCEEACAGGDLPACRALAAGEVAASRKAALGVLCRAEPEADWCRRYRVEPMAAAAAPVGQPCLHGFGPRGERLCVRDEAGVVLEVRDDADHRVLVPLLRDATDAAFYPLADGWILSATHDEGAAGKSRLFGSSDPIADPVVVPLGQDERCPAEATDGRTAVVVTGPACRTVVVQPLAGGPRRELTGRDEVLTVAVAEGALAVGYANDTDVHDLQTLRRRWSVSTGSRHGLVVGERTHWVLTSHFGDVVLWNAGGEPRYEHSGDCVVAGAELICGRRRSAEVYALVDGALVESLSWDAPLDGPILASTDGRRIARGGTVVDRRGAKVPRTLDVAAWHRLAWDAPARWSDRSRTLAGTVTLGGRPVPATHVTALVPAFPDREDGLPSPQPVATVRTDRKGRFRLEDLPASERLTLVAAWADGVASAPVAPGAGTRELALELDRRGMLQVRVVDGQGHPVAGAHVRVADAAAITGEDGVAALAAPGIREGTLPVVAHAGPYRATWELPARWWELPPAPVALELSTRDRRRCRLVHQDGSVHAAVPAPFWCDQAALYVPAALRERTILVPRPDAGADDLVVENRTSVTLTGIPEGRLPRFEGGSEAIRVAEVVFLDDDGGRRAARTVRIGHPFEVEGLPAGTWAVHARTVAGPDGLGPLCFAGTVDVPPDRSEHTVTVASRPCRTHLLRLADEAGIPAAGALVSGRDPLFGTPWAASADARGRVRVPLDEQGRTSFRVHEEDLAATASTAYPEPTVPPDEVVLGGRAVPRRVRVDPPRPGWWRNHDALALVEGDWVGSASDTVTVTAGRWEGRTLELVRADQGVLALEGSQPAVLVLVDADTLVRLDTRSYAEPPQVYARTR